MTHIEPIVKNAKFAVHCACGFAKDSAADTPEDAIKEVAAVHEPSHTEYAAVAYA